ncbi:MAG: ATP-binding protein [Methanobacteriota archaeon]|nr:MAG: ATP-binding protein [Euryarchaeota archaeon]
MPKKAKKSSTKPRRKKRQRKRGLLSYGVAFLSYVVVGLAKLVMFIASLFVALLYKLVSFVFKKAKKLPRTVRKVPASYVPFEEVEAVSGSIDEFEDSLYNEKSLIGLIVGARGSGKSALGMRILENVKARGRKVAAMGFKESSLPPWVECISSIDEIRNGSFVLIDEGGIEFSSRSSMSSSNKLLTELMLIARHKDLSILFITQNSSNIEVNTLRQVDYLLLKRPSLLQLDFERKKIREIYTSVKEVFERHKDKGIFYIYSDHYLGFASAPLPSFWSESLSKSYSTSTKRQ